MTLDGTRRCCDVFAIPAPRYVTLLTYLLTQRSGMKTLVTTGQFVFQHKLEVSVSHTNGRETGMGLWNRMSNSWNRICGVSVMPNTAVQFFGNALITSQS